MSNPRIGPDARDKGTFLDLTDYDEHLYSSPDFLVLLVLIITSGHRPAVKK